MINPISFLWRQFNGPQITAICNAIWQYFKDTYDNSMEYYRNLSIDTAVDKHLTLIGIIQHIARPFIEIPSLGDFTFTEPYNIVNDHPTQYYPSTEGFATNQGTLGGTFTELTIKDTNVMPTELFRKILRANANSKGILGSLETLDDILYALWDKDTTPSYGFNFYPTSSGLSKGDVEVELGNAADWTNPAETFSEVKVLGETVYSPIPAIIPKMIV